MPASSPPRILVIRRRYLGDIVLLGPFLRNLRLHWPDATITVFVEERFAEAYGLNPDVNRILTQPEGNPVRWLGLWHVLFHTHFTHVFDLDANDRTALLTRLTRAPFRGRLEMRPRFRSCYTHSVPVDYQAYHTRHITVTQSALLTAAGVPLATRDVKIVPREEDVALVRERFGRLFGVQATAQTGCLLIHPGSRSACRLWPADRFGRICDRVKNELGARVALVAGPDEQSIVGEILRHTRSKPAVIDGILSLAQFAALAAQCDAMLCHDSGPMHVAAAVGTPVVALLGSQNPVIFAPLGEGHTVLQAPLPCQSCVAPGTCVPGDSYRNFCVRNLSEEQVFAALKIQLGRPAGARRA